MKDRIERLMADLGCNDDDKMLVLWNNAPGAVVLIERLFERIQALELQLQLIPTEPQSPRKNQKALDRIDVSEST